MVMSVTFRRHPDLSRCGISSGRLSTGFVENLALLRDVLKNLSTLVIITFANNHRKIEVVLWPERNQ